MSESRDAPAESLEQKESRLIRELEYLKRIDNVSALAVQVDTLKRKLGISSEELRDCHPAHRVSRNRISSEAPTQIGESSMMAMEQSADNGSHTITCGPGTPTVNNGVASSPNPPVRLPMPTSPNVFGNSLADSQTDRSSRLRSGSAMDKIKLRYFTNISFPVDSADQDFSEMDVVGLADAAKTIGENTNPDWGDQRLLGYISYSMFLKTRDEADLDTAIQRTDLAFQDCPTHEPSYWIILKNLIVMLAEGFFANSQRINNLKRASNYGDTIVSITEPGHVDKAAIIHDVFLIKSLTALECGGPSGKLDIDEAAFAASTALEANREWKSNLMDRWNAFEKATNPENQEETFTKVKETVAGTSSQYPHKPAMLSDLSRYLMTRFEENRDLGDLDEARKLLEEAISICPIDSEIRGKLLANSSALLMEKFQLLGREDDLHQSRIRAREAYGLLPKNDSRIRGILSNIYVMRYEQTGDPSDIQRAEELASEALKFISSDDPEAIALVSNAASTLVFKFQNDGSVAALDGAIELIEMALKSLTNSRPTRKVVLLANLGEFYAARYQAKRNKGDLDLAIAKVQLAFDEPARILQQLNLSELRGSLSSSLFDRFKLAEDHSDLDMAITEGEKAIEECPPNARHKAKLLYNLSLIHQYIESPASLRKAADLLQKAAELDTAPPRSRVEYATKAARSLIDIGLKDQCGKILSDAVRLLPLIAPRQLAQEDQERILSEFEGLATLAASIALEFESASRAVELLELGRGVITGLRFGMRTNLDNFPHEHRHLALEFEELRDKLDSPEPSMVVSEFAQEGTDVQPEKDDLHDVNHLLKNVLQKIRCLDGFKHFLLPPPSKDLMMAASSGPIVIINVSQSRCDALIVTLEEIKLLELTSLHHSDILEKVKTVKSMRSSVHSTPEIQASMSRVLEWLWDAAVGPILDHLHYDQESKEGPRIWWIPTGPLALLPLHAAGYHSPPWSHRSAIDRVISSYSSSIKALQYTQKAQGNGLKSAFGQPALLVSMPKTPGQANLEFAKTEVDALEAVLLSAGSRVLKLSEPNAQATINGLKQCSIFHFAGHGESHPTNPSMSLLLTADWQKDPLTVKRIIGFNLSQNPPFLAYLSACSTNESRDETLHDEAIHLVTAFQLAGFQHVVGTMWEVSDYFSQIAAEEVYKPMIDCGGATRGSEIALGVHRAVRKLRDMTYGYKEKEVESQARLENGESGMPLAASASERTLRPFDYEDNNGERDNGSLIWTAYLHIGP